MAPSGNGGTWSAGIPQAIDAASPLTTGRWRPCTRPRSEPPTVKHRHLSAPGERDHARLSRHLVLSVAVQLTALAFAPALDAVRLRCAGVLLMLRLGLAALARLMRALPPAEGDAHGRQQDEPEDDRYAKAQESRTDRYQEHR